MKKFNYKDIFINKHVAISRAISMVENSDSQVAKLYDKIYKYYHIDFRGSSFLLHPDVLLYNAYQYSYKDICIYVAMASARSYAEYAAHGKLSLDLLHLTICLKQDLFGLKASHFSRAFRRRRALFIYP